MTQKKDSARHSIPKKSAQDATREKSREEHREEYIQNLEEENQKLRAGQTRTFQQPDSGKGNKGILDTEIDDALFLIKEQDNLLYEVRDKLEGIGHFDNPNDAIKNAALAEDKPGEGNLAVRISHLTSGLRAHNSKLQLISKHIDHLFKR